MKNKNVVIIFCTIVGIIMLCGISCNIVFPLKYKNEINEYARQYQLSPTLVCAVICAESRFDVNARSASGACGIMQIMPTTFDWINLQLGINNADIFNYNDNIKTGCFYLNYLFKKYQNIIYVLACYNAGEGVVNSWGNCKNFSIGMVRYKETETYINRVLCYEKIYRLRY